MNTNFGKPIPQLHKPPTPVSLNTTQHKPHQTEMSTSTTNEEPPSGLQGSGTPSSPYDGGNAPETTSDSVKSTTSGPTSTSTSDSSSSKNGEEPPNAQKGAGTVNEPFDGGNKPGE